MQLRQHPSMSFREHRSWPPVWTPYGGFCEKHRQVLQGEIGVLKEVRYYSDRRGRIYLTIGYENSNYVGCLMFDDEIFCEQTAEHLQRLRGMPIEEIGSSEIALHLELH